MPGGCSRALACTGKANFRNFVSQQFRPYKVLVDLFFSGGADTFNLLVPQNCPLYDEYVVRAQTWP